MYTVSVKLTFYIPYSASLKDKRKVRRSIIDKARQKFNASISEVDTQELHQTLTIGVAVVSGDAGHAQNSIDEIIRFMDGHTDTALAVELTNIQR